MSFAHSFFTNVALRSRDYPNSRKAFVQAQTLLYAHFFGVSTVISGNLDGLLAQYKERLLSLDVERFLRMQSVLHMAFAVGARLSDDGNELSFSVMLDSNVFVYGRSEDYKVAWYELMERISDNSDDWECLNDSECDEFFPHRLLLEVCVQMHSILHLPEGHPRDIHVWRLVVTDIMHRMSLCLQHPNFRSFLTNQIDSNMLS